MMKVFKAGFSSFVAKAKTKTQEFKEATTKMSESDTYQKSKA